MMQAITKQQKMMASASDDLADVVRKRGNVRIDTEKLTQHAVKLLDSRLAKAVEAPIQRVEQIVAGLEERVSRLGAEKLAEMTSAAREVIATSEQAERRVERLAGKLTWAMIGQVCQALVPFAVAFIVLGGLVGGASQMLGIGPLLGWTWDSFAAATALWSKALIALGALGGCAGFSWLIWWAGRKLYESYRGW
ncbi:hypothetical protein V5R04_03200 [Jonesiaceae bacterium BS-20]|uniref:Uncharacterized protein n=1 Tax=Jonesiaceae bacterium BS-20 TaxID=3120821 RepID=A0AAU7DYF6_9MICO